jgi:hypothetical protein
VTCTGEGYESVIVTEEGQCVGGFGFHRSERIVRRFHLDLDDQYPKEWVSLKDKQHMATPYCTRCGNHTFSDKVLSQSTGSKGRVWLREDTGERADNLNAFGPGAMYLATWYPESYWKNGEAPLHVRTPGGDWNIDGRASNCTMPDDDVHACWPRQGTVPHVTVSKSFGNTCSAGGGSIAQPEYHGFLREGFLIKC